MLYFFLNLFWRITDEIYPISLYILYIGELYSPNLLYTATLCTLSNQIFCNKKRLEILWLTGFSNPFNNAGDGT